jgi:hypothetical protein
MPDNNAFDGIICLGGEDWWYHNRGHFDFQIMRRLARDWPVLFREFARCSDARSCR